MSKEILWIFVILACFLIYISFLVGHLQGHREGLWKSYKTMKDMNMIKSK